MEEAEGREPLWSLWRVHGRSRGAQPLCRFGVISSCATDHGGSPASHRAHQHLQKQARIIQQSWLSTGNEENRFLREESGTHITLERVRCNKSFIPMSSCSGSQVAPATIGGCGRNFQDKDLQSRCGLVGLAFSNKNTTRYPTKFQNHRNLRGYLLYKLFIAGPWDLSKAQRVFVISLIAA